MRRQRNRLTAQLLTLTMAMSLLCGSGWAAEAGPETMAAKSGSWGALTWKLDDAGTLTLSGKGPVKSCWNDEKGDETGAPWYARRQAIKQVVLKSGVTGIGSWAFAQCPHLTRVTIPDTVTYIEEYVFYQDPKLDQVKLPDGLTQMKERAFGDCTGLNTVTPSADMSQVDYGIGVFENTPWMKQMEEEAGDWLILNGLLLRYAGSEEQVTLPSTVKGVAAWAFYDCGSITDVTVPKGVTNLQYGAFTSCSELRSVSLPDSLRRIDADAFSYCANLTEIQIPDKVTKLGESAFYGCTRLKSVTLPQKLKQIGGYAFSGCTSLKTLKLPDTVTGIGESAFSDSGLTSIRLSKKLTGISDRTFQSTPLTGVTLPKTLTSIGHSAFRDCTRLKEIVIPASVKKIGNAAFDGSGLKRVQFQGNLPKFYRDAGDGAYHFGSVKAAVRYPMGNKTWTRKSRQKYGGKLTWTAVNKDGSCNPKAVTGLKVTSPSKAALSVKWKENLNATGYQLQYSTSGSFKGAKTVTVKQGTTTACTVKKLARGKKYYVRIRANQAVSKKNHWSPWTASKGVTVKK